MSFKSDCRMLVMLGIFMCQALGTTAWPTAGRYQHKWLHPVNYEHFCRTYPLHRRCMGAFAGGGKRSVPEDTLQVRNSSSAEVVGQEKRMVFGDSFEQHNQSARSIGSFKTISLRPSLISNIKTQTAKEKIKPSPKPQK